MDSPTFLCALHTQKQGFSHEQFLKNYENTIKFQKILICSANHLMASKIMLNVEKLRGSAESDLLSVMQTSIISAALQASGENSILFSDSLLLFALSLCSVMPLSSPSCSEINDVEAGMHLKNVQILVNCSCGCLPANNNLSERNLPHGDE